MTLAARQGVVDHRGVPHTADEIQIRPIRPADADRLVAFHEGLSSRTKELRFFTPHPHLSAAEVHHFTAVDHHTVEALLAFAGDQLVGVARFGVLHDPVAAEVAFVVTDGWQGRGVGRLLFEALADRAREEGIHRFVAETLEGNAPMIGLFRTAGLDVREEQELGRVEFVLLLHDTSHEPLPHRRHGTPPT